MRITGKPIIVCLVMLSLVGLAALPTVTASPDPDHTVMPDERDGQTIYEEGDETHSPGDAMSLGSGDVYYGHLDRVGDRRDYFTVTALQLQVINVHVRVLGHDGIDEWVRPTATTPPSPPPPVTASTSIDCFIYHAPDSPYPLDGAYNYFYVRDYVINICAPVPGTHTYLVNVSMNWAWTPNNYTWDYMLELDVGPVPTTTAGQVVEGSIDLATRDTLWYKVRADPGHEVNGSFEVLNFNTGDPEERNVNIWAFPDDLGGYPRAMAWDWSAAPNEPVEPFSILATYDGWYYIKLRGMNHDTNLPCTFRLEVHVQDVPEFPEGGVQGAYFDRHHHDTDWYSFDMRANRPCDERPGLWNEVRYFNMTERADAEDLPDFDLYLFGLIPGGRQLDLLDSSFRNDHADFMDPEREPNKNTEHVRAAAMYNGTYYVEVNAWNNTGYYDLRMEVLDEKLSDDNNLPERAMRIDSGVYQDHIHQAFDHYDWYKVVAHERVRVQFDSHKGRDMFNVSFYKYDATDEAYVYITGGWNLVFNLTSREDEMTNLVDVTLKLDEYGLGAGTYYISVFAAVATDVAVDPDSGRIFVYTTDSDAKSDYELRVWSDGGGWEVPPTWRRIPEVVIDEDTSLTDHMDLMDYVDKGSNEILRFRARVYSGELEELLLDGSVLGFKAAKDFNGKVIVRLTVMDAKYLQVSTLWTITFTPVNDAPESTVAEPPLIIAMPEDSLRQIDLDQLVHDVDEGDVLTVTFDTPEGLFIDVDPDTMVANVSGDPDWFGETLVTMTFTDTAGASVDIPVRIVVENVADPPVLLKEIGTVETAEDTTLNLDLSLYIRDPDRDPLSILMGADQYIVSTYDPETGILSLSPAEDWSGGRRISGTAKDPDGNVLQFELWLEVYPVMDEPIIVSWAPFETAVTLREGGAVSFVVIEVDDPDSHVMFYYWYLDATLVSHSIAITFQPGVHDQGRHELEVRVVDETGLWDSMRWGITVEDVSHPPEGGIASPSKNGRFSQGETVSFVAVYHDLDGNDISYRWTIDGNEASTEREFAQTLGPGDHHVALQVTSGDDVVTEELSLTVVATSEGPSLGVAAVAMIVLLGVVLTILIMMRRRR